VRPKDDYFEIIDGNHRTKATIETGMFPNGMPCRVKEMTDEEALLLMRSENAHSEWTRLELGRHAASVCLHYGRGKRSVKAFAKKIGQSEENVRNEIAVWEVYEEVKKNQSLRTELVLEKFSHIVFIHTAPKAHWADLCDRLEKGDWTVKRTVEEIEKLKDHKRKAKQDKEDEEELTEREQAELRKLEAQAQSAMNSRTAFPLAPPPAEHTRPAARPLGQEPTCAVAVDDEFRREVEDWPHNKALEAAIHTPTVEEGPDTVLHQALIAVFHAEEGPNNIQVLAAAENALQAFSKALLDKAQEMLNETKDYEAVAKWLMGELALEAEEN